MHLLKSKQNTISFSPMLLSLTSALCLTLSISTSVVHSQNTTAKQSTPAHAAPVQKHSPVKTSAAKNTSPAKKTSAAKSTSTGKSATVFKEYDVQLKVLSQQEQDTLFAKRLTGTLGGNVDQFANVFFVRSTIDMGTGIGLNSAVKGFGATELEPAFAANYKPTLRELLDAIALQTGTRWAYVERSQYMKSTVPPKDIKREPESKVVIIDFLPSQSKFDYAMTPAKDWKVDEHTNFVMYVPPIAPMAMDLHLLGKVSADDKTREAELLANTPRDFALDQYQRAKPDAKASDLTKTKVGDIDAYYFETPLPPTGKEKVRWRQWHFMIGNQLNYVISTILPAQEQALYPQVQAMLKTFKAKGADQ